MVGIAADWLGRRSKRPSRPSRPWPSQTGLSGAPPQSGGSCPRWACWLRAASAGSAPSGRASWRFVRAATAARCESCSPPDLDSLLAGYKTIRTNIEMNDSTKRACLNPADQFLALFWAKLGRKVSLCGARDGGHIEQSRSRCAPRT